MSSPLLTRNKTRPKAGIAFLGELALAPCRVHEICGNARETLALMIAQSTDGPIFWVHPSWSPDRLNPDGILEFIDPARLTFVAASRAEDLLWCLEEILRAGVVPLVVGALPGFPRLTAVRRLHLAAETGAAERRAQPLGLLLTPGVGGAQGCETRWSMQQDYKADSVGWHLERRRARTAPPKAWHISPQNGTYALSPALLRANASPQ